MTPLFTDSQFDRLAAQVRQVLGTVGYQVTHPQVKDLALRHGCRESAQGRLLFPAGLIDEVGARLREQYPPGTPGPGGQPLRLSPTVTSGYGNITPKVFMYARDAAEGATLSHLTDLVKFAQQEPRITGVTLPVSRQDVAPALEQIEGVLVLAELTAKPLGAVDATWPEAIPYLAAMGEALGYRPADFVGSCNCINPPLRLEYRTAETMLQRAPYHSLSMITPMPCLGGSAPVDTWGAVVQGTAEIIGGLSLSLAVDPEAPLLGYIACTQLDMRAGDITSSSPQTIQVDAGVYQLMEARFGGGTRVGGRSYVTARRPGFQAVFEKLLKAIGYAAFVDDHALGYPGHGTLDNGSVHSPEQFLLDLEVTEGLAHLWTQPQDPGDDVVARIAEGTLERGGNFLQADHTLTHYRAESWDPAVFARLRDTHTERVMLDQIHDRHRSLVAAYEPAAQPPEVLRELRAIRDRALQVLA